MNLYLSISLTLVVSDINIDGVRRRDPIYEALMQLLR